MFGKKKTKQVEQFDPAYSKAIMRCSICTGEQVAGFKDTRTGEFHEVMLIRGEEDLNEFKRLYHVDEITKVY